MKKLTASQRKERTSKYPYGRKADGSARKKPGRKKGKLWAGKKSKKGKRKKK